MTSMRAIASSLVILSLLIQSAMAGGEACSTECAAYRNVAAASTAARVNPEWGQLGHQCDAISLTSTGSKRSKMTAYVYTAAAASCAAGCFSLGAGEAVCQGIKNYSLYIELAGMMFMKDAGLGEYSKWNGMLTVLGKGSKIVGSSISSLSARLAGSSCMSMGILTVLAAMKWKNIRQNGQEADRMCNTIRSYQSGAQPVQAFANAPTQLPGAGGFGNGAGARSSSAGPSISDEVTSASGDFPDRGIFSAAVAGPGGDLITGLPDRTKLAASLSAHGINLNDIARSLDAGKGPGEILSALPGLSSDAANLLKAVDDSVLAGQFKMAHEGEVYVQGGSGTKPKGATPTEISFDIPAPDNVIAGGQAQEINFENRQPASSSTGQDIWHAHYSGTIFQIVSSTLNRSRDRVNQLEYASSLNRALSGQKNVGR